MILSVLTPRLVSRYNGAGAAHSRLRGYTTCSRDLILSVMCDFEPFFKHSLANTSNWGEEVHKSSVSISKIAETYSVCRLRACACVCVLCSVYWFEWHFIVMATVSR